MNATLARLVDGAVRRGYGLDAALDMSPRQLIVIARINAEDDRADLISSAIAARAAQSDKKNWVKFMDQIGGK